VNATDQAELRRLPSVDDVLKTAIGRLAIERHGQTAAADAVRASVAKAREAIRAGNLREVAADDIAGRATQMLDDAARGNVRSVHNLTGTVLHTNLGRAVLAEAAIEAATRAMRQTIALEFDLETGKRGERDGLVRDLICELTGAEAATVVNNNAAAVLLVLNTFGKGRESILSRGELIEIGGAFRMPAIMARAGTKLVEVGTTNRTHAHDYEEAISARTGLILKVHTSNYRIEGFTAEVLGKRLAQIAHSRGLPLINDLGSGTLVDLRRFGLAHEPTVREAVEEGADLVTFSGDKLLGGPQAGFIVGCKDLIAAVNRNPMKRAMRIDKIRLAAIEATLQLYSNPETLAEKLPTLRHLAREAAAITSTANRLAGAFAAAVGDAFAVDVIACKSQVGSGSVPQQTLESAGIAIRPKGAKGGGRDVARLADALRRLPVPVIGRIEDQAVVLDLRCVDDEKQLAEDIAGLPRLLAMRGGHR
jgi:L-seryl-tRNA(Ser) seleniumtransferase